jgi:hypothetical protein
MQNITSVAELKNAIQFLEAEQSRKAQLLKEQFFLVYENLKPVNLLRKALQDLSSSPLLIDNIFSSATGLASGYLSKKLYVGSSGNLFRKLIGSIIQLGVTMAISRRPDLIKSVGKFILQFILRRNETNSKEFNE